MNYKKIIPSQDLRLRILKILDFLPDKLMIKIQYKIATGRSVNLKNPQRLTDKIQWYKLYYRDKLMQKCVDKYTVREYVASKGYSHLLTNLYGVYNNANEIDFNELPDKFVLKVTNGSHTNIICKNKNKLDINKVRNDLNNWLNKRSVKLGREWAYYNAKPLIICEEYLEDAENQPNGINDFKFICMNGEVKYVWNDIDRYTNHKRNFYDRNWNFIDVKSDVENCGDIIEKPKGYEKMLEVAQALSKDFPQVRVDLYWVNNKVYFGELTFYLLSGYVNFHPDKYDFIFGEEFKLPNKKNSK